MDSSAPTPSWMVATIAVFALAAVAVFGLYLTRHAQRAALEEQHAALRLQVVPLRLAAAEAEAQLPKLDEQIKLRKAVLDPLERFEETNKQDVDRTLLANRTSYKGIKAANDKALNVYREAMRDAPQRRNELGREEERSFAAEKENDERRRQLRDDVEKQTQVFENKKKEWRRIRTDLEARITELESRKRQLTSQLDVSNREFKSDGSIMASQAKDGYVVIDRGFAENLRNGLRFTVFSRRAGAVVDKGQIQVIEVREHTANARVLIERDANDPLVAGDQIHNPVYDPNHKPSYAIRGDFQRYSRIEIARFIQEAGAALDDQLSVQVDFLVAGTGCDADIDLATKLGMSIVSEDQLLQVLHIDERPSSAAWDYILRACKEGRRFALAGEFTKVDERTIEASIERNGGRTSGSVHAGDAALIIGDRAIEAVGEAHKLGVPVIDQIQFIRVAGPK